MAYLMHLIAQSDELTNIRHQNMFILMTSFDDVIRGRSNIISGLKEDLDLDIYFATSSSEYKGKGVYQNVMKGLMEK